MTSLWSVTIKECRGYEQKVNSYINALNRGGDKQIVMIMIKSYFDDIILKCDGIINISHWKKQIPTVKDLYKNNVPESVQKLKVNKWRY